MNNKKFFSETFIKDLLIIHSLLKTDCEAPKTARQVQDEVEKMWNKAFPNNPLEKNTSLQTIHRHVQNMNLLEDFYNIELHDDNKLGYYNTKHLLTTAEAAVIGAAIYNISSLTDDEKKNIFSKIKSATNTDGGSVVYGFELQMKRKPQRKTQDNLDKIELICKAIVEGKKINFRLRRNRITTDDKQITASPYLVIEKDSELFLTAKVDGSATPADFNLSLMSKIEIQDGRSKSDKNDVKENTPPIELKISFPESLIENVVKQFRQNKMVSFALTGEKINGECQFRVTIFVGEDEKLYQWLRQHCGKIKINSPDNVRDKLKEQLSTALSML